MSNAWLDSADVLAYLKVTAGSENEASVELCRRAAAAVVARHRRDLGLEQLDPAGNQADADKLENELADVVHGATLLTARLYARKGSPAGVASFGELGAAMILRTDPDIGMLCGIGRYATPRIG